MNRICCFYSLIVATSISLNMIGSSADARELLKNGSFEVETGWDDGLGLGNDVGFATNRWPYFENGVSMSGNLAFESPPGLLGSDFTGVFAPRGAGDFFGLSWGAVNGDGHHGSATQIVQLGDFAGKPYHFSAWLGSARRDEDHAVVTLDYFSGANASGSSLGSVLFDGIDQASSFIVGSLNLEGHPDPLIPATQDNWTLYRTSGRIPLLAQSAAVVIRSPMIPGTNNGQDAYVDLVSFQVIPEPNTLLLAGVLLSLAICWRARRGAKSPVCR